MCTLVGIDEDIYTKIIIKKKDTRFLSLNINDKRIWGMGTTSQDAREREGKWLINMLVKLQKTTPVINFKHKHLLAKNERGWVRKTKKRDNI